MALNFTDTTGLDHGLATELHHNPRYHTIAVVPYGTEVKPVGQGTYVIWKYEPAALAEVLGSPPRHQQIPAADQDDPSGRRAPRLA